MKQYEIIFIYLQSYFQVLMIKASHVPVYDTIELKGK